MFRLIAHPTCLALLRRRTLALLIPGLGVMAMASTAYATAPKDTMVIGKSADLQTLDPATTINNNDWTVPPETLAWISKLRPDQKFALAAPGISVIGIRNGDSGAVLTVAAKSGKTPQHLDLAPGLTLPAMNPVRGKELFASKGCVVCHSINKVGGTDAPAFDAATMAPMMNPFEFMARMWRGAIPMIAMQQNELGHQIEFTGQDLADIIAFTHNREVQKTFTMADIPPEILKIMNPDGKGDKAGKGMMMKP
ncbi:MAG: c-type cytochrome [Polaromonas sp.]